MALTYGFNLYTAGTTYTAAQFCDTFWHLTGDSVASYGTGFELTLNSLMKFTVGSGYVYVNGCWYKSKNSQSFTLENGYTSGSRYDALTAVVDYEEREVTLQILTDIDPDVPTQSSSAYQCYLYIFSVPAGAVELTSSCIEDNRTILAPLSEVLDDVQSVYDFVTTGIEEEIAVVENNASAAVSSAANFVTTAETMARSQRGVAIGDIRQAVSRPTPTEEWLSCNGVAIQSSYSDLIALLGSAVTPNIAADDDRLSVWIYAGVPDS